MQFFAIYYLKNLSHDIYYELVTQVT